MKVAAAAAGVVFGLCLGEAATRAALPPQAAYDERLGWAPQENASWDLGSWTASTGADGIRTNGRPRPAGRPVMVVGDSFAFGSEVSDNETWPSMLESMISRPVLNAGVGGYGLDQAVLRAEQLVPVYRPSRLVVGVWLDDIRRCGRARHNTRLKPYFRIDGNNLVAMNRPVPREPRSALVSLVVAPPEKADVGNNCVEVSRLLIDRLWRLGVPVVVVVYGRQGDDAALADGVMAAAAARRFVVVDSTGLDDRYFIGAGHFTAFGNDRVARRVAEAL